MAKLSIIYVLLSILYRKLIELNVTVNRQNRTLLIVGECWKKLQLDNTTHFTWGCDEKFSKLFIDYHE